MADLIANRLGQSEPNQRRRVQINAAVYWPLGLSIYGWAVLNYLAQGGEELLLCLTLPPSLFDGFLSGLSATLYLISPTALAAEWGLMVLAMMLPMTIPHLSPFCMRLFRNMQLGAVLAALGGFVLVWLAIGLFAVPLMLVLRAVAFVDGMAWFVPAFAYGLAILWSYSALRQKMFRRCHVVPVVCGQGGAVYRAALGYGVRLGGYCGATCGFAMAAPMLSGQGILAMALVTHVLLKERLSHRVTPAQTAVPLALIGSMALF